MKKFLAVLLTVCMLLSSFAVIAYADDAEGYVDFSDCDRRYSWSLTHGVNNKDWKAEVTDTVIRDQYEKTQGGSSLQGQLCGKYNWPGAWIISRTTLAKELSNVVTALPYEDLTYDITGMNYLQFDLYVSNAEPLKDVSFQFEIGSGGIPDKNENEKGFALNDVIEGGLKDGWNHVVVELQTSGGADLTKINWFRLYSAPGVDFETPKDEAVTYRVDNFYFSKTNSAESQQHKVASSVWVEDNDDITPQDKDNYLSRYTETADDGSKVEHAVLFTKANSQDGWKGATYTRKNYYGTVSGDFKGSVEKILEANKTYEGPGSAYGIRYTAETPVDASNMKYFAFLLYVSDAAALNGTQSVFELTSSGTSDKNEHQFAKTWGENELEDGWNLVEISLENEFKPDGLAPMGADFTQINYFRMFNGTSITTIEDEDGNGLVIGLDNLFFHDGYDPTSLKETHGFTVLDEETEGKYLVSSTAGTNADTQRRFNDKAAETIYKFNLKNVYNNIKVEFAGTFSSQLLLQVSLDGENWTNVYEWKDDEAFAAKESAGLDRGYYSYDLTDYVMKDAEEKTIAKTIWVRIADSYPANGWGGSIYGDCKLVVSYKETDPEIYSIDEMTPDDKHYPIYGWNDDYYDLDTENNLAGYGCLTFTFGLEVPKKDSNGDIQLKEQSSFNVSVKFEDLDMDPIDFTGWDTLEFDLYISDLGLIDLTFADNCFEITSSGTYDQQESNIRWPAIYSQIEGGAKVGWNHVSIPLKMITGDCDWTAVNFMRLYMVNCNNLEAGQLFTFKIDNMYLSKKQAALEEAAKPFADAVRDQIQALGEIKYEDLTAENIDEIRAKVEAAEKAFDELDSVAQGLITSTDKKPLTNAKRAIKEYDKKGPYTPGTDDPKDPTDPTDPTDPKDPTDPTDPKDPTDPGKPSDDSSSNNTTVIIIVVVAVVVVAAAVCVYFFVIKKKE